MQLPIASLTASRLKFQTMSDSLWYKDAIIYELHVKTFHDSNADGIGDFRGLIEKLDYLHELGLRVIIELVINHTSDQNPWFQKSRRAPPGSAEREVYVWSDTPEKYNDARIIFKDFETSNWSWDPIAKSYYWHRFYSHQPDLNFDNSAVHEVIER